MASTATETQKHGELAVYLGALSVAGIEVTRRWELVNLYWNGAGYDKPPTGSWWLFQTHIGLVRIGMRKRVIEVDWEATSLRGIVTADDVTKDSTSVHAWTTLKLAEYLVGLKALADKEALNKKENERED